MVINKDSVYVINQPRHSIITFIVLDKEINEDVHKKIDTLQGMSDIMFILSNGMEKIIDPFKFAELYQSSSFICSKSNIHKTLFEALLYAKEIYNTHVSFMIVDVDGLEKIELGERELKNLESVHMSSVELPIMKIERNSYETLKDIYTLPKKEITKNFWTSKNNEPDYNIVGKYYTWNSTSNLIFLRGNTVNLILKDYEENKENTVSKINVYLESFETINRTQDLIASYLKNLGINNINEDVEKIKGFTTDRNKNIQAERDK